MLAICLLGQFQVDLDEKPVEISSRPAQSLLAYLALNAGVTHRREKLAGMLWPESEESNARNYLRQALWHIRKSLENESRHWEDFLQINKISITFDKQSGYWLDVDQLTKPAADRPLEEIIEELRLYRGELLPGFYDEWIGLERNRLEVAYSQKIDHLLEHLIQARRWEDALEWGEQWILYDYSAEPAYWAIMKAYAGLGNPGMVRASYQRCVKALSRDLEVEPSAETTRLFEQLVRGEQREPESAESIRYEQSGQPPLFFEKQGPRFTGYPLVVARELELEKLNVALGLALSGRGRVIFVTGEAGSGKTTLINEFTRRAQNQYEGLIVASGNCNAHTGIGDPYLPFREILELLSGDVEARWLAGAVKEEYARFLWNLIPVTAQALVDSGPDLIDTFVSGSALLERARAYSAGGAEWFTRLRKLIDSWKQSPGVQSQQQSDLFIQYSKVLQILSRSAPLILVVDDLQWADLGSISLLFHLGRHLAGLRILIVGAYRPEDIALGRAGDRHPLEPVVNEIRREFGDIEINVDLSEYRTFVDAILDSEPNRLGRQFRDMLYLQTRGQPLFTIELLHGMQERGDLVQDEKGRWVESPELDWDLLPARVEAVIAERIGRLDHLLQATLRTASVEGEFFTAEIVARVQAEEEIRILGRLSNEVDRKHHLVRAQSIQRINGQLLSSFRFRHILVQKYLYNSLDEVERVYLHEQIGNTLEELFAQQAGIATIAPQLARHFQEARNTEKAINYLQIAGERALQVFAYQEAISHLERGLELLATLPDPSQLAQQELSLQLALSMASHLWKAYPTPEMEQASARALELCQQVGNTNQLCQILNGLTMFHYVRGEQNIALELAEKTLDLGRQAGDWLLEALGHWFLGIVLFTLGRYSEARNHLEQVTTFYEPDKHHSSFLFLRGIDAGLSAMAYLACCLMCLGYPDQALKWSQQALDLAHQIGHSFSLADVLRYGGCEFNKIRRDALALKRNADELISLSQEKNFASWLSTGKSCLGEALVMLGHPQEGIPYIREGMMDSRALNVGLFETISRLSLAEAYASLDDPEQAMTILNEALELLRRSGEGHWEAELYRMRAAFQEMKGEDEEAESSLEKALEVARQQEARWWELRAAIDLAHLWQKHGRTADARQLVKEVYSWFTEGFDTPELREAKELCG